jgi:hypothetical protein
LVRGRGFGNVRASSKTTTSINKVKQIDRWSRTPKSIQDRLAYSAIVLPTSLLFYFLYI